MVIISRFAKSFLLVVAVLVRVFRSFSNTVSTAGQGLLSMVAFLHPPARAYIDPWTGQLFGEGGVEGVWHNGSIQTVHGYTTAPILKSKPEDFSGMSSEELESSVHGGVIMSKLGNATAKYVRFSIACNDSLILVIKEQRWDARHGNCCTSSGEYHSTRNITFSTAIQ